MDGLEKLDHTHAIFSGFSSIWQRMFLFCACGVLGQFIGGNIYNAPEFVRNVLTNGASAIADLRPMDLAWLPMEWAGTLVASAFYVQTAFYLPVLLFAFLKLVRDDETKLWPLAVLLIGQPIDAWLIRRSFHYTHGSDFVISLVLLIVYTALTAGGFYMWWHVREDHEE